MRPDKVLSLLGLARRGGKIQSGAWQTENAVKTGTAELVVIAKDASENTKKKFRNMCSYYEVPCMEYGSGDEIGHSLGQGPRMMLAVCDEGLARQAAAKIRESCLASGISTEDSKRAGI